ncbi:uncharacterized protein LOC129302709 [Prosopis cineraria]|uniref:uncharacterized protein LOC129302709 n=1 Tax=Prosopis cineraria TaxID=364024 RepID=UPI00240F20B1|nr:uncharacterized protein LOC129302709 [Prosopis cineraria]
MTLTNDFQPSTTNVNATILLLSSSQWNQYSVPLTRCLIRIVASSHSVPHPDSRSTSLFSASRYRSLLASFSHLVCSVLLPFIRLIIIVRQSSARDSPVAVVGFLNSWARLVYLLLTVLLVQCSVTIILILDVSSKTDKYSSSACKTVKVTPPSNFARILDRIREFCTE